MVLNLPKKGLRIAHINVNSLRNKVQEISTLINGENINVLAVSETHLDESITDMGVGISGYNIFRNDRNIFGGGVAIYIQSHIPAKVRSDLMSPGIEALWLEVHLAHCKQFLVGCVYRPPSSNVQYIEQLCSVLIKVTDMAKETFVLGDFNIDWLSESCPLRKKLNSTALICNLTQMVNKPTRVYCNDAGHTSATCIDHIFTNNTDLCSKAVSVSVGFSDHNIVAIARKNTAPKAGPKVLYKRSYRRFCENAFIRDIENVEWNQVLALNGVEEALKLFNELFLCVADRHVPLRKFTVGSSKASWIDDELRACMRERDQLKKAAIDLKGTEKWQMYCIMRNKVTKLNRKKKRAYYQNLIQERKNDGNKLWRTLNEIMGRGCSNSPSFIEVNGSFLTNAKDIANHFNDHFADKVDKLRKDMGSPRGSGGMSHKIITNIIMKNKQCVFKFQPIEIDKVEKLLDGLNNDKPAGMDNVDGRLLKVVSNIISLPICHIFNLSLKEGLFPQVWKSAKVVPLPKNKRDSFSAGNSRPISILPVLSKLMEKVVLEQVLYYFSCNQLNSDFQHAYKSDHSTGTALTEMVDKWLSYIDKKMMVGAVLLDFSAAFDVVDHGLLLRKLGAYGFSPTTINWMNSYLSNRMQCVFFNGSFSSFKGLQCGVPQGSCLGPLLYTIFTNDMPFVLDKSRCTLFADDSTVYYASNSLLELNNTLQSELKLLLDWISENRLVLNVAKTKSIVFTARNATKEVSQLCLSLKDSNIEQVQEAVLLGVTLDGQLTWEKHIEHIVKKMGRGIACIKRCSSFLTPASRVLVTKAVVLSHLDYCSTIWSGADKKHLSKLQIAQNKAARLALHCPVGVRQSTESLHASLSWLRVEERLACNLVSFFRNICHSKQPSCLYSQIQYVRDRHNHVTRQATSGHMVKEKPRTNAVCRSVMFRAISIWNTLPTIITEAPSKASFKRLLKRHLINYPNFNFN